MGSSQVQATEELADFASTGPSSGKKKRRVITQCGAITGLINAAKSSFSFLFNTEIDKHHSDGAASLQVASRFSPIANAAKTGVS